MGRTRASDFVEVACGHGDHGVGIAVERLTGLRLSRIGGQWSLPYRTGDSRAQAGSN